MKLPLITALTTAAMGAALLTAGMASAQTPYQPHHPRRAEVNHRLASQNQRIKHELRTGQISPTKARRLLAQDHAIRGHERMLAANDHGHISRADQARLNQRENAVGRKIGA